MTEAEFVEACMASVAELDNEPRCPRCGQLLSDTERFADGCRYCAPA